MLTKALLNYKILKGKVYPHYLDCKDNSNITLAKNIIEHIKSSKGKTEHEINSRFVDEEFSTLAARGLIKLAIERCKFCKPSKQMEEQRWKLIMSAQSLREEKYFSSYQSFQESFEKQNPLSFKETSEALYSDLPEFQTLIDFQDIKPEELLDRYNCSLVQSLLVMAPKIDISFEEKSPVIQRKLFQAMKFHNLVISHIDQTKTQVKLSLDGPLSLFGHQQTYGMRLANFFPHLIWLTKWSCHCSLQIKKRNLVFEVSNKQQLVSHYKAKSNYIPEEFTLFMHACQEKIPDWHTQFGDKWVKINDSHLCFPDLYFTHNKSRKIFYLELFHQWHQSGLVSYLENFQAHESNKFIFGICQSLAKQPPIKKLLEQLPMWKNHGFIFKTLPTPKNLYSLLKCG